METPINPFKQGTKKFLIAQQLLAGETDDKKIVSELGIKKNTLWGVKSQLRRIGLIAKKNGESQAVLPTIPKTLPATEKTILPGDTVLPAVPSSDVSINVAELSKQIAGNVLQIVNEKLGLNNAELPTGVQQLPLEEVEVVGERVNYKVALNAEIFWRHSIFKAQNARLVAMGEADLWTGDFSDFLDLATKTLLNHYGMYPTVSMFSKGKMFVELPMNMGE